MKIAIVGGGLSGCLMAIRLLKECKHRLSIYIIEKEKENFARGVAYAQSSSLHPLNVRAGNMSLFPEDPDHFFNWLTAHAGEYHFQSPPDKKQFIHRKIFGDYLHQAIDTALKHCSAHEVKIVYDKIINIEKDDSGYVLNGEKENLITDAIIIATGNFPPSDPPFITQSIVQSRKYESYPWKTGWLNSIKPDEKILFIGSGLTMIDQVLSLHDKKHQGKIYSLSRNGRLPHAHIADPPLVLNETEVMKHATSSLQLFKWIRSIITQENNIYRIIDGLRPYVQKIWQQWPLTEKQRFMRHLRPLWEVYRHRIPAESARILKQFEDKGQFTLFGGRIKHIHLVNGTLEVTFLEKKTRDLKTFTVDKIVNCSGPEVGYRKINDPFFMNLFMKGFACTDEMQMGLKINNDFQLINIEGTKTENIFTLGSLCKGTLWESTAVPDIREQAKKISAHISAMIN